MAHFAKIENGIVTQVIVADTKEWCETNLGGQWEQTSYNTYANEHRLGGTPFRYNYAGIGFTFDPNYGSEGAFIPPQPFPSWKLSNVTAVWKAPVPEPDNGKMHNWDEATTSWVEVTL